MRVFVEAVGVLAPGIENWDSACAVLAGAQPYRVAPLEVATPTCLPPAERRRSSANVRLALAAAEQALARTPLPAQDMAMVFASAEASGPITHQICVALAGSGDVSPTQFHNSVHNAPSGYFSIAMNATRAASSVCCGHWSFAAGLLHAAAQAVADRLPVLFACYDSPMPPPLCEVMPILDATALALVLTPEPTQRSLAAWELAPQAAPGDVRWPDWIPAVWHANASARGFAALATLADPACRSVALPLNTDLQLQVARC